MKTPSEFDDIRPFESEELPEVYDRLLASEQFQQVLNYLYPNVPVEAIGQKMHQCKTSLEFQKVFAYPFLKGLISKASTGCDMDSSAIDNTKQYTFVSNHRDIVLDSAFLSVLLIDNKFETTCEIAIGDNLLSLPWVRDLARLSKSFIVKRGLTPRELMLASVKMARYMIFALKEKHENLWIAQREGRAKDSNDLTQKSILKMFALGAEGTLLEKLQQFHIVPLAISYEYDPCDYLKAAEMQAKRDDANWKKGPMDDVVSMQTGIMGYKGTIHYQAAPCIDEYLETLKTATDMSNGQLLDAICLHIDKEIHRNYRLYANNYVALDELEGTAAYTDKYTAEDKAKFDAYLEKQLAKIEIPNKDEVYLRQRMLEMYANPTRNYLKANA
ncbi:1-acyl-sn-glycerol-3-phosphate acyltransferase [Prevotella intermedia]|uniref:Acyltransferase n=1 Tax=Prevotella intermedia TaxID=28131 RepID=A0A2M8M9D4_PREIN|nr:1-acyl-sn-glycerol-3-phosphate acyltransferase [Prevotella intermedia]PJF00800.1 acyltransferase [Prevotella intermedia]